MANLTKAVGYSSVTNDYTYRKLDKKVAVVVKRKKTMVKE